MVSLVFFVVDRAGMSLTDHFALCKNDKPISPNDVISPRHFFCRRRVCDGDKGGVQPVEIGYVTVKYLVSDKPLISHEP